MKRLRQPDFRRVAPHVTLLLLLLLPVAPATAIELPPDAKVQTIHPNAWSFEIIRPEVPLAVYGFVWDLDQPILELVATAANGRARGLQPMSAQLAPLETAQQRPIAAVNGDFYAISGQYRGITVGPFVLDGRVFRFASQRPAMLVLADRSLRISHLRSTISIEWPGGRIDQPVVNGTPNAGLVLYTPDWGESTDFVEESVQVPLRWNAQLRANVRAMAAVAGDPVVGRADVPIPADGFVLAARPDRAEALRGLRAGQNVMVTVRTEPEWPVRQAVAGNVILVRDGRIAHEPAESEPRHPRTAIGFDRRQAVAVVIDGRAPGHSRGISLPELADFMLSLGCTDAINLDGGGSSTCWVRGSIVNVPSDGRERSVANGFALMSRAPLGAPARIAISPRAQPGAAVLQGPVKLAPGASVRLETQVMDRLFNPLRVDAPPQLQVSRPIGQIDGNRFIAGTQPGAAVLHARHGRATGELELAVVDRIASLSVQPARIELLPEEPHNRVELEVTAYDSAGDAVLLHPRQIQVDVAPDVATIDGLTVHAGRPGTAGILMVRAMGVEKSLPIAIAEPVLLVDFREELPGHFTAMPEEVVRGSVEHVAQPPTAVPPDVDDAHGSFARLHYQFQEDGPTQAAYLRLDRSIDGALALRLRVRGDGQRVNLRALLIDARGGPIYHVIRDAELSGEWQTFLSPLPPNLSPPVTLQSLYVVRTGAAHALSGHVDFGRIEVLRVPRE